MREAEGLSEGRALNVTRLVGSLAQSGTSKGMVTQRQVPRSDVRADTPPECAARADLNDRPKCPECPEPKAFDGHASAAVRARHQSS